MQGCLGQGTSTHYTRRGCSYCAHGLKLGEHCRPARARQAAAGAQAARSQGPPLPPLPCGAPFGSSLAGWGHRPAAGPHLAAAGALGVIKVSQRLEAPALRQGEVSRHPGWPSTQAGNRQQALGLPALQACCTIPRTYWQHPLPAVLAWPGAPPLACPDLATRCDHPEGPVGWLKSTGCPRPSLPAGRSAGARRCARCRAWCSAGGRSCSGHSSP